MAGKPRIEIDFDKIYESNFNGPFKIIENMGRDERSRLFVKIRFINTGTERIVRYDIAMAGKIIDELYGIDFNKIFYSMYYGPYKIIQYIGRNHESKKVVRIKFINTGYEYNVLLRIANLGLVRDYSINFKDKSFNVPCEYKDQFILQILKFKWHAMMYRCYNNKDESYSKYGAIGVSVCERWHDMNNYILDMPHIPYFWKFYREPNRYNLDKDYLQSNIPRSKRIYSPETCMFLSIGDNTNLSIKEKLNSEYYGIKEFEGNFQIVFSIDGAKYYFGTYSNFLAALNDYNYYYSIYGDFELVPLFNENIIYMSHEEAQKYLLTNTK